MSNMTFAEWIPTQDPAKWQLDPATISSVTDYFYYRRVADDVKMDLWFWRTLDMWRDTYKKMVRVENIDFDPLVSKYFEAEYTQHGTDVSNGNILSNTTSNGSLNGRGTSTNTGTVTDDGETTGGHSNRTTIDQQVSHAVESNFIKTDGASTTDSGTVNTTDSKNTDVSGNVNVSGNSTNTNTHSDTENVSKTYAKDVLTDGSTSGNSRVNETSVANADVDATAKAASKDAPMSASGVTSAGGNANGKLGKLDFQFATGYNQSDTESNSRTDTTSNSLTNNAGTSRSDERTTGNDSTLGNKSGTSTDRGTSAQTTIDHTVTGVEGSGSTVTDMTHHTQATAEGHNYDSGQNNTSANNTDVGSTSGTTHNINESRSNGQTTVNNTTNNTSEGSTTTTGNKTNDLVSHNRYTGRDGLTPQDALASATVYLATRSLAFKWLVKKLDTCFISVYEL